MRDENENSGGGRPGGRPLLDGTTDDPIDNLPRVLVVSDDPELGGLVALNLRRRQMLVSHADVTLALTHGWEPPFGRPDILIVDVDVEERLSLQQLGRLAGRTWAVGVPLLLAARYSREFAARLASNVVPPPTLIAQPDDVRAIVSAARSILTASAPLPCGGL